MEQHYTLDELSTLDQLAVNTYVRLIQAGRRTLESVPPRLQPYVAAQLENTDANG